MNPFCLFDNMASSVWLAAPFSASTGPSLSSCAAKKTSFGADCRVLDPPVQHLKETLSQHSLVQEEGLNMIVVSSTFSMIANH